MEIQNLYFQMLIKKQAFLGDIIEIEGYASTENIDFHNHIIDKKGRTQEVIDDFMLNPALLLQHKKRVGSVREITIDDKGLYVKAVVENNVDNCFEKIKLGHIAGFSVGIRLDDFSLQDNGGVLPVLRIEKMRMFELSIVEIPANNEALFTFIKSIKKMEETIMKKMMDVTEDNTEATADVMQKEAKTVAERGCNIDDETSVASEDESAETSKSELMLKIAKLEATLGALQEKYEQTNNEMIATMARKEDVQEIENRISKIPTILAKSAQSQAIQHLKNTHKNINTFYKAQ